MTNELRIKTTYSPELIAQEVRVNDRDWHTNSERFITKEVIRLKDEAVREALIRMGWTPPRDDVREGKILIDGIWNSISTIFMEGDTSSLPQIDDRVIDALSSRDRVALAQGAVVKAKAPDGATRLFRWP